MVEVLPEIPRFYTACAEFLASMLYVVLYSKNLKKFETIFKIIFFGIIQILMQSIAGMLPIEYWVFAMFFNLLWMYGTIYILTEFDLKTSAYLGLKAFVLSEFIASAAWQIYTFLIWRKISLTYFELTLLMLVIYWGLLVITFFVEKKTIPNIDNVSYDTKEIMIIALITSIVFTMSNMGFLLSETRYNFGNYTAIYNMRTIIDFNGLCIIFMLQIQKYDRYLKQELNMINNVFGSRQYDKYIAYKENLELVNQKLHDLKHQVYIIKNEENYEKRGNQIDNFIVEINNITENFDTGNQVLDTLLTTKSIYCIEHKIIFSCIADGRLINFMELSDICSIFGNAFDNAIESVLKESALEKRLINLRIMKKQQFVIIKFNNYCENKPEFKEGLPITTKKNKDNHGYGLKSVRYTAEKYNGSVIVDYKDNWFTVKILIPKRV